MKNEMLENNSYYYYFPVKLFECSYGQIYKPLVQTNLTYCSPCSSQTYSLNLHAPFCKVCPEGADCSTGLLVVNNGYWRVNEEIFECFPNSLSCLYLYITNILKYFIIYKRGGLYEGDESCASNYLGPICQSCKRGFYKDPIYSQCVMCETAEVTLIFMSLALFVYFAIYFIMIK